jgi:hypothetical protein
MSIGDNGELIIHEAEEISPKNAYVPSITWDGMWLHCKFAGGHSTFVTPDKVPELILMAHLIGM